MNIRQTLTAAAAQLATDEHLRASSARDAELLLLAALGITRATLLAHPEREIAAAQQALYRRSLDRRMRYEPIQYILGEQEFYGLMLQVNPAVLIPRPETEHLVEAVLHLLPPNLFPQQPLRIADVGTGSGAIAIALAVHLPRASITALDLSPAALAVAAANAARHGVAGRIRLLHSDLLAEVNHGLPDHRFDAIVSNPPYIPRSERPSLHSQVRDHEPHAALFAGETGLDIYRRLIPQSWSALNPGGLLALEIGQGQQDAIAALLSGWSGVRFLNDLQGIARVALAHKADDEVKKG